MQRTIAFLAIAFLITPVCMSATEDGPGRRTFTLPAATLTFTKDTIIPNNIKTDSAYNSIIIMEKVTDEQGNIYMTGGFTGRAWFGENLEEASGEMDYFLAKYTARGVLVWITVQGGINSEIGYGLTLDMDDNVYVAGAFESSCIFYGRQHTSYGDYDAIIHKYDENGIHLFTKQIVGGKGYDEAYRIAIDSLGFVQIYGSFSDTAHTMRGMILTSVDSSDLFLLRLYPNGAFASVCQYGTEADDNPCRIAFGEHRGKSNCVAIVWSNVLGGPRFYVWFTNDGILDSESPLPTPE